MKQYYFLKLNPPRATFSQDMTPDERQIMQKHVVYWTEKLKIGKILVFGPVLDPNGIYGVGVIAVENESEREELIANDPANGLQHYEYYAMKAIVP
jgi:uncharacterized protein